MSTLRMTGGLLLVAALTGCPGQSAPSGAHAPPASSPAATSAQAQPLGEVSGPLQGPPSTPTPSAGPEQPWGLAGAAVGPDRGSVAAPLREDDKTAVSVDATIQNVEGGKARFDVKGRVGYLPNGAVLTISLRVRDLFPLIEAAFFQVELRDGAYEGFKEWDQGTFAPIGYQTAVTLSMQSQNPLVRKYLGKELGYTSETVVTIGTDDDDIGSPDERTAFAIQTLKRLSQFETRIRALHADLAPRLETPADAAWPAYAGSYKDSLKAVLDEIAVMRSQYLLWYEGHRISMLEQCLRVLSRAARNHGKGLDGKLDAATVLTDLVELRADIDARLPVQPGEGPKTPPAPQTEKR